MKGRIDKIGYVTDPTQHTVMVMGRVDNPGGRLRAGQFITATVDLPPSAHEVVVPASAVVEDGRQSIVFVQPNPEEACYSMRQVAVAWRSQNEVHLRSRLGAEDAARGLQAVRARRAGRRRGSHPVAFRPGGLDRVAKGARQGGGLIGRCVGWRRAQR